MYTYVRFLTGTGRVSLHGTVVIDCNKSSGIYSTNYFTRTYVLVLGRHAPYSTTIITGKKDIFMGGNIPSKANE